VSGNDATPARKAYRHVGDDRSRWMVEGDIYRRENESGIGFVVRHDVGQTVNKKQREVPATLWAGVKRFTWARILFIICRRVS
jgi:hypothetical protein